MTSSITLIDKSVVILGQDHNPSILNPDFLWRNDIVSEDIKIADNRPPITTPLSSVVYFENGSTIVSEPNRVLFAEKGSEESNCLCCEWAKNYLRTVLLVNYTAVGINFTGFIDGPSDKLSPHNMLKTGPWDTFEDTRLLAEIKLAYFVRDRDINLTISEGKIPDRSDEQKFVVQGNFHHNIRTEQESYKVAIANVDNWGKDLKDFKILSDNINKGVAV